MLSPFHLAYHVNDLTKARHFYGEILGCNEGRSAESWVDFSFFGHQLSLHLGESTPTTDSGTVDNQAVPMPHMGVLLPIEDWRQYAQKLKAHDVSFIIEPSLRFENSSGEQATMFFKDPFGNAIEIKGFANMDAAFNT